MKYQYGKTRNGGHHAELHRLTQANRYLQRRAEAAEDRVAQVEWALRSIATPGTALAWVLADQYDGETPPETRRSALDTEVLAHHENQRTLRSADALH